MLMSEMWMKVVGWWPPDQQLYEIGLPIFLMPGDMPRVSIGMGVKDGLCM